jgi:deoxyhypusine synthase
MEINKAHIKYIEWRSIEELHEEILNRISELRFTKDEQQFLEDLVLNHTMGLLAGKSYELSRNIITRLTNSRDNLGPLLKKMMSHNNDLQSLLDEITNIEEMEDFKKLHNQLMSEFIVYNSQFKKVKKQIFKLIKQVLKEKRQMKLLN